MYEDALKVLRLLALAGRHQGTSYASVYKALLEFEAKWGKVI